MKYLISILISLIFLSGCEDKGYGTQNIEYVPSITSSNKVQIIDLIPKDILAQKTYISLEFSSYMNINSLNISNISLVDENDVAVSIEVDAQRNFLYIKPLTSLVDTLKYTLSIKKSIEDILGNGLDRDYSRTFTCSSSFWQSVEAGDTHSMAKSMAGDIYIWGSNTKKQIIDFDDEEIEIDIKKTFRSIPLGLVGSNGTKDYSAGGESSSAVTKDDTLFSIGQFSLYSPDDINLSTISSGTDHISYVKSDGTLWSWGENDFGQLGDSFKFSKVIPVQEFSLDTTWTTVNNGKNFTLALKFDGTLWGWGDNSYGQIGDTVLNERRKPNQESTNATDWDKISAGGFHSAMIKTDGTLWSFGQNDYGQLGNSNYASSDLAVQENSSSLWLAVAAGYNHTCAIKNDSTLWCWGNNHFGQLGINNTSNSNIVLQEDTNATNWQSVSTGKEFTLATKSDGTLWAWGYNRDQQLGLDNNNTDVIVPTEVK